MKNFMKIIDHLEKHLLPSNFTWHDKDTEKEIKTVLNDLRQIYEKFGNEMVGEKKQSLEKLYSLMCKIYMDYRAGHPNTIDPNKIDNYLVAVGKWFEHRYSDIDKHKALKTLYKKGCEFKFKKRIDVEGVDIELKGPAIIICTHHHSVEPAILQAMSQHHIHWVGDPGIYLGKFCIHAYDIPFVRPILNKQLGIIEINKRKPEKHAAKLIRKSLRALERGQIVGIFPLGHSGQEIRKGIHYNMTKKGFIVIVQYAERHMGIRIPLIPVAVRKEEDRYVVIFDEPFFLPPITDKEIYADTVVNKIYNMRNKQ